MPAPGIPFRLTHRTAGLGSLGHARYVAIADWHGGRIAREAKALVPSSSHWAQSSVLRRARALPKFFIRPSSTAPFAVPIPSSSCADAGSSAALVPTAPASNSLPCVAPTPSFASSTPWDRRLRTSISARPPHANSSSAISTDRKGSGCTTRPKKCFKRSAPIGKSGKRKATPDVKTAAHADTFPRFQRTRILTSSSTQLEAAKSRFDSGHAAVIAKLLSQLSKLQLNDPRQLIRFHEALLFLRAFPHSPTLVPRVEHLLNACHQRVEKLRDVHADMSVFDDFDTSGIAGTAMQDTLSFDVARWLVRRIPRSVEIAWDDYWDDYQAERARGNTWPRFVPLLEEDADVEANIPWQRWLDAARGRQDALSWILEPFRATPACRPPTFRTLRCTSSSTPLETRKPEALPHPQLDSSFNEMVGGAQADVVHRPAAASRMSPGNRSLPRVEAILANQRFPSNPCPARVRRAARDGARVRTHECLPILRPATPSRE